MYTTCEAGKRRSVNHTRALARLAEPGRGRGEARPAGRAVRVHGAAGRAGAVRCDEAEAEGVGVGVGATGPAGAVRPDVLR